MIIQKPIQLALVIAGIYLLSSLSIGFLYVAESNFNSFFVANVLISLGLFLLVRYLIEKFIFNRINLIYSKIINIKKEGYNYKQTYRNSDQLEELNKNVDQWVTKTREDAKLQKNQEIFRKEYIGNISHELKTPTFNIQGYVLTLLDGGLEDENINREYLLRASKSIDRMIEIIDDLDTINRLESDDTYLNTEVFNIVEFTKEMFQSLELRAKKKSITFNFDGLPDKKIDVMADKPKIGQVFTNLLVNAIKYSGEGSIINVNFEQFEKTIMVSVQDNGIGISPIDASRVFERFYRVDKSRSRSEGGSGLGLAIVKHIIEAHKQTITLSSEKGKGSIFTFTLSKG